MCFCNLTLPFVISRQLLQHLANAQADVNLVYAPKTFFHTEGPNYDAAVLRLFSIYIKYMYLDT